jgi:predicted lactoylglutathione lyase
MAKEFWLSLPVKNLNKSKEFFTKLGFMFNNGPGNSPTTAPLIIGNKSVVIMLCEEPTFHGYTGKEVTDTEKSNEVLLSFDANSKEEVDELVQKAIAAGGTSNHKATQMKGFMYGCVFSDLDGHRWNILHMDTSKM